MNAITLDFLQEIVIPNLFKVLFKVNTPLCRLSSELAIITWSSANKIVFNLVSVIWEIRRVIRQVWLLPKISQ
jgi:hypothetical protein